MPKRRHFLQFAASTLATLGISSLHLRQQSIRYRYALAQPASCKRALLVGINRYAQRGLRPLRGCVTDVDLQRELLIHRFGFEEGDIRCLTDEDATRENILDAFETHLIEGCDETSIAVFHFSGHGRRVADSAATRVIGDERDPLNSTLVPYQDEGEDDIPDIMGKTLFLLTSKLRTNNVTLVLDSCYAEGGVRGNVRVRSGGRRRSLSPSQAELDYQARLIDDLNLDPDSLQELRDISIAKGIALAAARRNQEAADVTFGTTENGQSFDAGAFTYFLTQYLWRESEPVYQVISNISRNLADDRFTQDPSACIAPFECNPDNPGNAPVPTYFVNPIEGSVPPPAEGVILSVNDKRGTVWLGGSDHYSLATYGTGAKFVAIAPDGNPIQDDIIVQSRRGLQAEIILPETLPEGTLLQEASRVIPPDYKLRVGLDPSVMAEFGIIQNTFSSIRRLELVPYESDEILYAGEVHYILSRMTAEHLDLFRTRDDSPVSDEALPNDNSLVILSQGLDEVIPGSWGESGETVEDASDRLSTKFNALVAARLVKLLVNANSSRLDISARMEVVGGRSQLAQFFTVRGSQTNEESASSGLLEVPVGRSLQFIIQHNESRPIYALVFIVDRQGELFRVFPSKNFGFTTADTLIPPGEPRLIPERRLNVTEPGFGEALIIASHSPLTQALQALGNNRTANTPVVDALIGDLSGIGLDSRSGNSREFRIQVTQMATMSIPFRAV